MVCIWQLDFYFLSKVVISVCVSYFLLGVSHSLPHNKVMYKESKTQENKRKLMRPVKMQEATPLKENTKERNSISFSTKDGLSFLLHLCVYLGA
jgi:hypothetical protein